MFKGLSEVKNQPYGSKKGGKVKKLRKYRFGLFMPYFDDVEVLAKNINYDEVIKTIDENFSKKLGGLGKLFKISFPGKKLTLYGTVLYCKDCEDFFLPYFDSKAPEPQDAWLPWPMLVMKDKAVTIHGKYFMALAYPDFGMFTLMKAKRCGKTIPGGMKTIIGVEKK